MNNAVLLFLLIFSVHLSIAQELKPVILSTAGTSYQGSSITIDWTLGELAITRVSNSNDQITQGFHQPTYTITKVNTLTEDIGRIKVFPNPTSDWLQMDLAFEQKRAVQFFLFDQLGKLLANEKKEGVKIQFNSSLKRLPAGNYYLNFSIDNNTFQQTFKIQKIK